MAGVMDRLKNHSRTLTAVASLVVIGGAVITGAKVVFSTPELEITRESTRLSFPRQLTHRFSRIVSSEDVLESVPDSLDSVLSTLNSFLASTESFTSVNFRNTTNHSLETIRIRITGLRTLAGWGVRGDGLTPDERRSAFESITHSSETGLLTAAMDELPAQATLSIYLWGDDPTYTFSDIQPITASYDGGGGELIDSREISGFDAFLYANSGLLLTVVVALNIALLLLVCSESPKQT